MDAGLARALALERDILAARRDAAISEAIGAGHRPFDDAAAPPSAATAPLSAQLSVNRSPTYPC